YVAQKRGGAMTLMAGSPFLVRIENVPVSYCRYLGKLLWPENLAAIYPVVDSWPMHVVLGTVALLLAVTAGTVIAHRSHPYLFTGWFWFLGTLVPVIGLVAVGEQSMADRYTYFPMIGVLIMITWGIVALTNRWRYQACALPVAGAAILLGYILLTR